MLTSIVTPAGYRVDASGKWIYSSPEETIFGNFIQNGEYKQYIADWYADPAKYGYLDIDGDGKKELIITSDGVFFYALICSADLQSGEVTVLDNGYYYGNVGYMVHDKWIGDYYLGSDGTMLTSTVTPDGYRVDASEKHHALVLTDVRPNSMMGDYAFVEINGSGMDVKFHLGWDATEGERYYKDKTKISEQEFSEYFKDLKELDYM